MFLWCFRPGVQVGTRLHNCSAGRKAVEGPSRSGLYHTPRPRGISPHARSRVSVLECGKGQTGSVPLPFFCSVIFVGLALFSGNTFAWQMKYAPIMTDWAQLVDTNAPLPEYPRPQMARSNWLNLNGIWQFQAGATNDPVPTNQ